MEKSTNSSEKKDKTTKPEEAFTQDDKNNAKEIYNNLKTGDVIKCWIKATSVDKNYNNDEKMKNAYIPVLYAVYQGPICSNNGKIVKEAFVFKINSKPSHGYECQLKNTQYTSLHNQISYVSVTGQPLKIDDIAQMGKLNPRLSLNTLKSMACALTKFAEENTRLAYEKKEEKNELEQLKYELKARTARMDCQFLNDYVEKAELRRQIEQQQNELNRKERIIQEKIAEIRELKQQLNEERERNRSRSRNREDELGGRYDNDNSRHNNNYRGQDRGGYDRGYQPRPLNNYGSQYNQYRGGKRGGRGGYGY